jgi:hypothetical protein
MDAAYPVSLVTHGQALNITCQSYDGNLAFGFTGCRDSLPHMQRIATYTGEALAELEQALAAPAPTAKPRRAAKGAAKPARRGKLARPKVAAKARPLAAKAGPAKSAPAKPVPTKSGRKLPRKARRMVSR